MTPLSLWLDLCGLSHQEAADYLKSRKDSVSSAASGRRPTPPGWITELRALRARIENAAEQMLAELTVRLTSLGSQTPAIDLGYAANDSEARSIGWPCAGAQRACLALVVAALPREVDVRLAPPSCAARD